MTMMMMMMMMMMKEKEGEENNDVDEEEYDGGGGGGGGGGCIGARGVDDIRGRASPEGSCLLTSELNRGWARESTYTIEDADISRWRGWRNVNEIV
eukprot:759825-Hanusia_phi.AAC.16